MKKIVTILSVIFLILLSSNALAWQCGRFEITDNIGTNKDVYDLGEQVYIEANGFDPVHSNPETGCEWELTRNGALVTNGTITTDSSGNISPTPVYTTTLDDVPTPESGGKEMIVYFQCSDCSLDYRVFRVTPYQIPEFSTAAALVALVGSVAVFMIVRKRH
ncbi:MAG: hypothetical protein AABW41_04970 [Nanoarchaeota archaeon]